jgi:low temperature requirement protein LtrA
VNDEDRRVSTLELFFDLVFVFTITQLTSVLHRGGLGAGLLHGTVMLALVFWMYDAFAWLTNAAPMIQSAVRRYLIVAAMAVWLVLALAIPHAFDGDGVAFGVAYLVIVLLHTGLYLVVGGEGARKQMRRVGLINVVIALVVILGGAIDDLQAPLWTAAAVTAWASGLIAGAERFEVVPAYFVERHGLIVIVTIGESIVAVGAGAAGLPFNAELVLVAVLGVLLSACLWWTYFGGDDEAAERAMQDASPEQRGRWALFGFGHCHLPMLMGIVAVAAGLGAAIAHPFDALAIGPAVFLSAGVVLATIPLGTGVSAFAQLVAVLAVFLGALTLEVANSRSSPRTARR